MLSVLLAAVLQIPDMARIVDLEEPAISSRGDRIALVAIAQDATHSTYVNRLTVVDVRTGRMSTLVQGHDVAVPRWAPRGSSLAYIARPAANGVRQLFVRTADGRTIALTHLGGDVIDAAWSPDGRALALVAADAPQPAPYFFAGDNDYTATALTPPDHLWLVSAWGGPARRLTSGDWTIAPTDPGGIFSPQIAWTRDGRHIAYTRIENTFSGDSEYSTLWQIDVTSGATRKLTTRTEFELSPSYSPDGMRLAYWFPLDGDFNSENTVRVSGQRDAQLARQLDRNIAASLWLPDSQHMLICAADGTQTVLWRADLDGNAARVPLGDLHPVCDPYSDATFDSGIAGDVAADGSVAFIATSPTSARELYYLPSGAASPLQLTHENAFLSGISMGTMRELNWVGPDGFSENGVVTYPPLSEEAKEHSPVVLLIHGGPGESSARDFVWEDWPLAQMIASHGYAVLQPNYRGSDNLGNAYMTAIVRNTVAGPSADILAGLDALAKTGTVDATRVAVSGWSYGGELTSWLIGHDHRWRAAVSGAAVNSEFDEYNLSTSNVQDRYPLGASPYTGDGERIYRENSPITYYAQITTPTLIWGTTQDPVVPIAQSYALYHALHDNGVPVRFAVFPASTHGPADPRQRAELTALWLRWLDDHMK